MRPNSVATFERLFLGSIVASTIQLALQANERIGGVGPVTQYVVGAAVILLSVGLVLMASRRRRNWARWVLAILTGASVAVTAYDLASGVTLDALGVVGLIITIVQAVAVGMLFTGAAQDWFARRG